MHELSIAQALIEQITTIMDHQNQKGDVKVINLRVGILSNVVEDALRFGFETAKSGTILDKSSLNIESVKVRIRCETCGVTEQEGMQSFLCPICELPSAELITGKELELVSIEFEEVEALTK